MKTGGMENDACRRCRSLRFSAAIFPVAGERVAYGRTQADAMQRPTQSPLWSKATKTIRRPHLFAR